MSSDHTQQRQEAALMTAPDARPLRADAERSASRILDAAERVLSADPGASMEQIAVAAGVARTTIHRRFSSRQALIDTMAASALRHVNEAVDAARPHSAPPLIALHQATVNALRTKLGWRFALGQISPSNTEAAQAQSEITAKCDGLFAHLRASGVIGNGTDLLWARRVYYGLIEETIQGGDVDRDADTDALAARIVETLLHGVAGGAQPVPDGLSIT